MHKEVIGQNAGKVWDLLNEKGSMTLAALKRASKIKEPFLSMSLGWLARENKIIFVTKADSEVIELI